MADFICIVIILAEYTPLLNLYSPKKHLLLMGHSFPLFFKSNPPLISCCYSKLELIYSYIKFICTTSLKCASSVPFTLIQALFLHGNFVDQAAPNLVMLFLSFPLLTSRTKLLISQTKI